MILGDGALGSSALGDLPLRSAVAAAQGAAVVSAAASAIWPAQASAQGEAQVASTVSAISFAQASAQGEAQVAASANIVITATASAQGEAQVETDVIVVANVTIDAGIPGVAGSGITDKIGAAGAVELVSAIEPSEVLSDTAQILLTDEGLGGPAMHLKMQSSVRAFSARLCARINDTITHGGQIVEGSPDVRANGRKVARVGDKVVCRMHGDQTIEQGAPRVRANGRKVARIGDRVSCGALIDSGSQNVRVGGKA